jgi:hypothetical protein
MANAELFDYWEVSPKDQTAIMGEFKKTTSGFLISLIIFKWTNLQDEEITSFRISPKASLKIVAPESTSKSELIEKTRKLSKTLHDLIQSDTESLPLEELENFDVKLRLSAWLELRKSINNSNKKNIEALGVNKATLVDYLNLQSLGIKDYQKILAQIYNAKPLTIRDRIAYARRHKWIEPVGHGERTSQMSRFTK